MGVPVPRHPDLISFLIIALASLAAFSNSLHNDFIRDDLPLIVENPLVHSWKELPNLLVSDYWAVAVRITDKLYRPLVMVSYLANYSISGTDPFGYHLCNVALQALVAFGVYGLGRRLRLRWEAAVLAAVLFAVHPIQTEVVDPITGRADLLSTLGLLLALNWYIDLDQRRTLHLPTALASWGAFGIGLFCKESTIILPGLLVLYELYGWHGKRDLGRFVTDKGILWLGYLLLAVLYLWVRWAVLGEMYRPSGSIAFVDNPVAAAAWDQRVLTALVVAGKYFLLFLWPLHLSPDYSYNAFPLATSVWDLRVLGSLSVWVGFCALAAWSYLRGVRFAFFAVGYLVITFLPVSNLILPIGTIMGERLFYMPSVALCLLIGGGWQWLLERVHVQFSGLTVRASYALAIVVVLLLTARTIVRNRDWSSYVGLWEAAAQVVPNSAKVHYILAVFALVGGRFAESRKRFERALEIYPGFPEEDVAVAKRYGALLLRLNRADEALPFLQTAVEGWPDWVDAQLNLGLAYAAQESWDKAEAHFRKAIALDINKLKAHKGLIVSLREQGRHREAIQAADEALSLKSDFIAARMNKVVSLKALGRTQEAQKELVIIQGAQAPNP